MQITENEIIKLKEEVAKLFKDNNKDIQNFDFNAYLDRKLTYGENRSIIMGKIYHLFSYPSKAGEIKNEKEKSEYEQLKEIKEQEQKAEQEFNKTIEELKKSEAEYIGKYYIAIEYIKSISDGHHKGLVFLGDMGLGKSFLTRQILSQENAKFIESRGVHSPMALYKFLYNNNKEDVVLVFDDVFSLINSPNSFSILLGALWDNLVCWDTTSGKLDNVPTKFIFKGRIIIIVNRLEGFKADVLKSRCLVYDLKLNRQEKLEQMYLIAKSEREGIKPNVRKEVVDFIKENTDESSIFDLRTQFKIEQFRGHRENWKQLGKELLLKNNEIEQLLYCIKGNVSIGNAEREWCKATGKSRRTFYNLKKEILH